MVAPRPASEPWSDDFHITRSKRVSGEDWIWNEAVLSDGGEAMVAFQAVLNNAIWSRAHEL
jgi:hypothetical protein